MQPVQYLQVRIVKNKKKVNPFRLHIMSVHIHTSETGGTAYSQRSCQSRSRYREKREINNGEKKIGNNVKEREKKKRKTRTVNNCGYERVFN